MIRQPNPVGPSAAGSGAAQPEAAAGRLGASGRSSTAGGSTGMGLTEGDLFALLKTHRASVWRALWLGIIAGILVLAPSVYMLQVYDRVVQSRSHLTLLMLTLAVVMAYAVMELLEYLRSEILRETGHAMDEKLSPRLFALMF